jgi:hypothetical protein
MGKIGKTSLNSASLRKTFNLFQTALNSFIGVPRILLDLVGLGLSHDEPGPPTSSQGFLTVNLNLDSFYGILGWFSKI